MADADTKVTGVLVGIARSEAVAVNVVKRFQSCPYVSLYACRGSTVVGVYGMPESRRWWLEWPQKRPEAVGLEKAAALITNRLNAPSPWTQGVVPSSEMPPCGADCTDCPELGSRCSGCPSTSVSATQ